MAEKEQQAAGAQKPEKPAGSRRNMPLMLIIGIVLILNGAIVGKVFLGGKYGSRAPEKKVEEVGKKLALEEFLVNLGDAGSEHYLKSTIALGLKKGLEEKDLEEEIAPIKDAVISVLSSSKRDEISTEAGKTKLKEEIKTRVNKCLGSNKVMEIYFTAFATQ